VPAHVTDAKFAEQLDRWRANAETYARRGWVLLSTGDLSVDIGFLQNVPLGGRTIPVMTACVRLDYWNFDLWAPSLTFLDPITRNPAPPPVRAPDRVSPTEVRDALIDQHPETLQPFLCLAGIREYHNHPQHSGDDWLLHRHLREGDLAVICDRVWRRMARNVLGLSVGVQSLAPPGGQMATQLEVGLLQGDADLPQRTPASPDPTAEELPRDEGSDLAAELTPDASATNDGNGQPDTRPDSSGERDASQPQGQPDAPGAEHVSQGVASDQGPSAWT
jgi:hypothetical protein